MKTRENELHEIIVTTKNNTAELTKLCIAQCSICEYEIKRIWGGMHENVKERLTSNLRGIGINYCPKCGARLKGIDYIIGDK